MNDDIVNKFWTLMQINFPLKRSKDQLNAPWVQK